MELDEALKKIEELENKNKELSENLSKQRSSFENKIKELEEKVENTKEPQIDVEKLSDEEFATQILKMDEDEVEEMTERELSFARKEWMFDQKMKEYDEKLKGVETKVTEQDFTAKAKELAGGDEELAEKILFTAKEKFGDLSGRENAEELLADAKILATSTTTETNNPVGTAPQTNGNTDLGADISKTIEELRSSDGGLTPDQL